MKKNLILIFIAMLCIPLKSIAGFLTCDIAPYYNEKAYPGRITANVWKDPDSYFLINGTAPNQIADIKNKNFNRFTVDTKDEIAFHMSYPYQVFDYEVYYSASANDRVLLAKGSFECKLYLEDSPPKWDCTPLTPQNKVTIVKDWIDQSQHSGRVRIGIIPTFDPQ